MGQKYVKVASAATGKLEKHVVKPCTTDRIIQLRKLLGLDLKQESVLSSIRCDYRKLQYGFTG